MSTELAIRNDVVDSPNLAELVETIRREHALVLEGLSAVVQHAILAGEALNKAKAFVPWGEWIVWVNDNFEMSRGSALLYMQVARGRDLVIDAPSLAAARRLVQGTRSPDGSRVGGIPDQRSERRQPKPVYLSAAMEMKQEGMTYRQIAEVVGTTRCAIAYQLRPDHSRDRNKKQQREYERRKAAEKKAFQRQERDEMMKTVGGDERDAYLTARKLAGLLDRFGMNAEYAQVVKIEDALAARAKAKLI